MRNEVDQVPGAGKTGESARLASCIGVLMCAVFLAAPAQAGSLGGMKLLSSLNEPLLAQVDINGNSLIQPGCAKAQINSPGGDSLGAVDVRIVNEGDKQAMMLATRDAMNEPTVNIVVQLNCDSREERSYPVLFDLAQTKNAALAMTAPATPDSVEGSEESDRKPDERIASASQVDNGVKLQLVGSLINGNLLAAHMVNTVDSVMNGDSDIPAQEEQNLAPTSVEAIGVHNSMHKYWQLGLSAFTALMGLMIWSFWQSARRVSYFPTYKTAKRPISKRTTTQAVKTQRVKTQVKTRLAPEALDPLPYTKPDMSLFGPTTITPSRDTIVRESTTVEPMQIAAPSVPAEESFFEDMEAKLPIYHVEEVVDEAQLARLWMASNQPVQAIKLFESYWGQKQPNSPVPWQCLLELYRTIGDLNKYRELIGRYNSVFGENASKRSERNDYVEEGLRKRA